MSKPTTEDRERYAELDALVCKIDNAIMDIPHRHAVTIQNAANDILSLIRDGWGEVFARCYQCEIVLFDCDAESGFCEDAGDEYICRDCADKFRAAEDPQP